MKVAFAEHLRIGAGCHEPIMNRGLELAVPPPDFWGGEKGERLTQSAMAN